MLVKETIQFQKKRDPKGALGLGIFSVQDFTDPEEAGNFIIENLEKILKINKIPRNLIRTGSTEWFADKYYFPLIEYIDEYLPKINQPRDKDYIVQYIHDYFLAMGFDKGYKDVQWK